jgi:glycosyltransferase involved in cell wall biosynthesis
MIDDGSDDRTLELAQKIAKKDPLHLRVIHSKINHGYGGALKNGFKNAKYNVVAFIDGDGQFDVSEITKFLDLIGSSDIVIGKRKQRQDNHFRHVLMNLLKIWDFLLFGFYFPDIDCGFKVFNKSAVDKIVPLKSEGAMITTEILAKAKKEKLSIMQVTVNHYPRKFGYQSGGNLRVIVRAVRESIFLWMDLWKN